MKKTGKERRLFWLFGILLVLQVIAALCFCMKKTGFHYDEYYSYYSSNVTMGLVPTDREWKPGSEIYNEFAVLPGEQFDFGTVVRMQTYDVHPPFYYLLLHGVCSLTPGIFSKWSGLALNLFFFIGSWMLLALLAWRMAGAGREEGEQEEAADRRFRQLAVLGIILLFGFNPAVYSGIMLVRMYMLLGFWVLAATWLHVRSLQERKRGWRFFVPLAAVVYLGFLTHYYFAVYLFFLAATMEFYLLFETAEHRTWGQKWKDCILYAAVVIGSLVAAVLSYPACLGHIFRGYRGTEAMGAFFDLGNTWGRLNFFVGLLNEYAFGGLLFVLILVLAVLAITTWALQRLKRSALQSESGIRGQKPSEISKPSADAAKEQAIGFWERYRILWIPAAASLGYFAVVTKTALLTAEEANRYQIPIYGMLLLLAVILFLMLVRKAGGKKCFARKGICGAVLAFLIFLTCGQIYGLLDGKVLFLYEEDAENIAFARQNADEPIIYFYNPALMWMIWDDSLELMQYDRIYFVNLADTSALEAEWLAQEDRVLVYAARTDTSAAALETAAAGMGRPVEMKKIRELLYCDLYEIKRKG
ncbi:MAG: hypothetical protein ACLTBS_06175 [Eisenbergiella sp.]|nr:hypothetical protein [Bacillota bacterium]